MRGTEGLIERLSTSERSVQRAACDEAGERLRSEPGARDELIGLLNGGSLHARFAAAFVLFHHDRPSLRLLAPLLDALALEDGDRRWKAAEMLAVLGRMHAEVLPVLLELAVNGDPALRRRMALYTLRELAPEEPYVHRAFMASLDDPDRAVRHAALSCFAKLRGPDLDFLQRVLSIAREATDPRLRRLAIVVLPEVAAEHVDAHAEVRGALATLTESEDSELVSVVRATLQRLDRDPRWQLVGASRSC